MNHSPVDIKRVPSLRRFFPFEINHGSRVFPSGCKCLIVKRGSGFNHLRTNPFNLVSTVAFLIFEDKLVPPYPNPPHHFTKVEPVPEVEIVQPSELSFIPMRSFHMALALASSNNMLCILTCSNVPRAVVVCSEICLDLTPVLANLVNLVIRHTILYKMIWNIALNHAVEGNFFDPLIQPKFGVPSILHMASHTPF
nr:hypothetical protein Iba_chr01aCG4130 [Ipomoea batatas]